MTTNKVSECEEFEPFNYSVWSALVRKGRKEMGCDTAEQFSTRIKLATGVHINSQTLYKIEQGKKNPSHTQYMAINMALYGNLDPPENIKQLCLTEQWKETIRILEGVEDAWEHNGLLVPGEQARINFVNALVELKHTLLEPCQWDKRDKKTQKAELYAEFRNNGIEYVSYIMHQPQGFFDYPQNWDEYKEKVYSQPHTEEV